MISIEVVVVGGGPAGATAARSLAKSGRDVVILEAEPAPRDKVCGGGLRPSVLNQLPHVEALKDRFLEATTTRGIMSTPGGPEISYTSPDGEPPVAYQVRRSVFDEVLLEDAVDAGSELMEGSPVVSAHGSEKGWRLRLQDGTEIKAKGVIGAGGAKCPLGRRMRAAAGGTPAFPPERLAVAWAREFLVGEDFIEEAYGPERMIRIDLREGDLTGYAWTFPKREHVNVGFGALVGDLADVDGRALSEAYARRLIKMGLLPEDPSGGTWRAAPIPTGGPEGPVSRPGVLAVGDCTGLISPLSGDGIYYAIRSGQMAASTMDGALEKGDLSAKAMAVYGREFKRTFNREMDILTKVAKKMRMDPHEMLRRADADPSLQRLVVQLFQGEGNIRTIALKVYGKSLLAGLRK
jgi:geranylgeranyl reductase family protein